MCGATHMYYEHCEMKFRHRFFTVSTAENQHRSTLSHCGVHLQCSSFFLFSGTNNGCCGRRWSCCGPGAVSSTPRARSTLWRTRLLSRSPSAPSPSVSYPRPPPSPLLDAPECPGTGWTQRSARPCGGMFIKRV